MISPMRTQLLFYKLLEESKNITELNYNIDFLIDCMRVSVLALCGDKNWNENDLDNELM